MNADSSSARRFDIALSFPGEHRDVVKQVADHLAATFSEARVLYDQYHDAEFARLDLDVYLPGLYRMESELIVLFLCPQYSDKRWCKLEWRHIRQMIATVDAGRIMFLSFGNPGDLSDPGILSGDGYIDILPLTPQTAAEKILKRLRLNQDTTPQAARSFQTPATAFRADISRIIKYAPAELIGREAETKLLDDAWAKVQSHEPKRSNVLTFFGDAAMAGSAQGAFDKGRRLAQLVGERRALLILDGLEPLQYAPTSPTPGELKDQGLSALIKGLVATSHGLCVVTTRYSIPDLEAYWQTTAPEHELKRLSTPAGVDLLRKRGVKGTPREFETLVEDVKGHALTLNLLGGFLKRAFKGDIRQRDRVKFEKADEKIQGGHAFRTIAAYVTWMKDESEEARRELAILQLLGPFDRPASADCIQALVASPEIPGLTEPLVGLANEDWEFSLTGLEEARLLTVNRDAAGALLSLDAHPLLREYFARRLQSSHHAPHDEPSGAVHEHSGRVASAADGASLEAHHAERDGYIAWRAAHRRLYEHLCASPKEGDQPTLEDLQPLYQAVAHGCQAGMERETDEEVHFGRITRGDDEHAIRKLGAFGSDLGAVACFFETEWIRVSVTLAEANQAWYLNRAAFHLRALGRRNEAFEPMRAGVKMRVKQDNWKGAAAIANSLSELELTLGEVAGTVGDAEQSVTYADRRGDAFMRMVARAKAGVILHQAVRRAETETRFREAEQMQAERQPAYPLLYSLQGFNYCDLLLADSERASWLATLDCDSRLSQSKVLRTVSERGAKMFEWRLPGG